MKFRLRFNFVLFSFSICDLCELELIRVFKFGPELSLCVLYRPVIGLTSIPSLSISKPNMLELAMLIWTDCEFSLSLPQFFLLILKLFINLFFLLRGCVSAVSGQWTFNVIAMHHILGTTLYWDSLLLLKMNLLEENATALCRFIFFSSSSCDKLIDVHTLMCAVSIWLVNCLLHLTLN